MTGPDDAWTLRPIGEADAPAVAQVHWDSWVATYSDVFAQATFDELPIAARERTWRKAARRMLDEPRARTQVWLAEQESRVIGLASFGPFRSSAVGGHGAAGDAGSAAQLAPDIGELYAIYLAPDALRRGIGSALFRTGATWLREQGFTEMRLWVLAGNSAAAFYRAMGGERVDSAAFTTHGVTIDEHCYAYRL